MCKHYSTASSEAIDTLMAADWAGSIYEAKHPCRLIGQMMGPSMEFDMAGTSVGPRRPKTDQIEAVFGKLQTPNISTTGSQR